MRINCQKLADRKALIKGLQNEGVNVLFGMPGGANLPIYEELYNSEIRHILVRHEQLAAHMADGFARVSRRPGVCLATSGPGVNEPRDRNRHSLHGFNTDDCYHRAGSQEHDRN